jgi:hypothetical protein
LATRAASKDTSKPHDYRTALRIPHWCDATEKEFSVLHDNGTWNLVPPVPGVNLIDSKWVFKVKLHADGSIERYKARFVAKGFKQKYGLYHDETFRWLSLPPSNCCSLWLFQWHIRQLDIQNVFLNGYLYE